MATFYEKLSMKLQPDGSNTATQNPPVQKSVSYNAANGKTPPKDAPTNPPEGEAQPDGTDPWGIDLFQSETRMVVFVQASGVLATDFEIVADDESDTLLLQATQKRPAVPAPKGGGEVEKGRFTKTEIKWNTLYRKVYLPAPFDAGETETILNRGVLIIVLPIKKPGEGKKLLVREVKNEEQKQEEQKK